MRNSAKRKKILKSTGAKEYNNWTKNILRGFQYQTRSSRRNDR